MMINGGKDLKSPTIISGEKKKSCKAFNLVPIRPARIATHEIRVCDQL